MVFKFVCAFFGLQVIHVSDSDTSALEDASDLRRKAWRSHNHERVLRSDGE